LIIGIQQLKPIKRYVSPEPCFILKRVAAVHFEEVSLALVGRAIHIQIRDDFQPLGTVSVHGSKRMKDAMEVGINRAKAQKP
jgi:hypothetical protein